MAVMVVIEVVIISNKCNDDSNLNNDNDYIDNDDYDDYEKNKKW